jgi:hypothetical protein
MAKYEYRSLKREVLLFSEAGNEIHLGKAAAVISEAYGIDLQSTAVDSRVDIDGRIAADYRGLFSEADATSVAIGKTGSIFSETALLFEGDGVSVVNRGTIEGAYRGIALFSNDAQVRNNGLITAEYGVTVAGGSAAIVNGPHGRIEGSYFGILCNGSDGDKVVITNHGTIIVSNDNYAVLGGVGNDTLINDGKIVGDVSLGDGFNVVDLRNGRLDGEIFGGGGRRSVDNRRRPLPDQRGSGGRL